MAELAGLTLSSVGADTSLSGYKQPLAIRVASVRGKSNVTSRASFPACSEKGNTLFDPAIIRHPHAPFWML